MPALPKSGERSKQEAEQSLLVDLSMSLPGFNCSRSFNSRVSVHMLPTSKVVSRTWCYGSKLKKCTKDAYKYHRDSRFGMSSLNQTVSEHVLSIIISIKTWLLPNMGSRGHPISTTANCEHRLPFSGDKATPCLVLQRENPIDQRGPRKCMPMTPQIPDAMLDHQSINCRDADVTIHIK